MKPTSFAPPARWLHWLIAALIVLQYVLAEVAEGASSDLAALALLAHHKSVGITILVLAVVRLGYRLRTGAPAWPANMPAWQQAASRLSHAAFYLLLFTLPLSGWLLSSAAAYSVSWFNLITLPDLVGPSETFEATLHATHEWLGRGLVALGVVHVAAALKHALIDRDEVMAGMWSAPAGISALALLVASLLLMLPGAQTTTPAQEASASTNRASDAGDDAFRAAALSPWVIDAQRSSIRFTGEQAGAPFTGTWTDWEADVRLAKGQAAFSARVVIDTGAVDTGDADRDATLAEPAWFDTANHPQATFSTNQRKPGEDGREVATGLLTIKGVDHPVALHFTWQETAGEIRLEGHAELSRLALGIGTGEWLDTTWVGDAVALEVLLLASRQPADVE